jgi:hypothetical protein
MIITVKPVKKRNAACAIFVKAQTFDNRPKRERTRKEKLRKALKDYGY